MPDDPNSRIDILARANAAIRERKANEAAAAAAGVPPELLGSYAALKQLLASGKLPSSPQEAASHLATAAAVAVHRGDKPVTLPGSDLPWPPPNFNGGAPLNYVPYLRPQHWRSIMAITFPQKPGTSAAKPASEKPRDRADALASIQAMFKGKDLVGASKPLAAEAPGAGTSDTDTLETDIPKPPSAAPGTEP